MMSKDTLIEVSHLSKKFSKNLNYLMKYSLIDISKNIFGLNTNSGKLRKGEFWAVDDISFKLKRGETLGIIGPNGSGKTTILKMLNGILTPDKGEIKIKGKVGALIQVGAGFHPLLTGRENIYVNGAILGMSKKEIDKKFDQIVEFADIGNFLDAPVKTYSSGMFVRLGFSVAVHSDPDILLVDEILAVGDYNFQRKCFEKMREKAKQGTSFVLVTHSMHSLLGIVKKAILLNKGRKQFFGPVSITVSKYIEQSNRNASYGHLRTPTRRGSGEARIIKAFIVDESGDEVTEISEDSALRIRCLFKINKPVKNPVFFFAVKDVLSRETVLFCNSEELFQKEILKKNGMVEFIFNDHRLGPRKYYLTGGIVTKDQYSVPIDMWDDAGERFMVKRTQQTIDSKIDSLTTPIICSPYKFKIRFKS